MNDEIISDNLSDENNNDPQDKIQKLEYKIREMEKANNTLKIERDMLQNDYKNLHNKFKKIEISYDDFKNEKEKEEQQFRQTINNLEKEKNQLLNLLQN